MDIARGTRAHHQCSDSWARPNQDQFQVLKEIQAKKNGEFATVNVRFALYEMPLSDHLYSCIDLSQLCLFIYLTSDYVGVSPYRAEIVQLKADRDVSNKKV